MKVNRELLLSWSLWFLAFFLLVGAAFFALGFIKPPQVTSNPPKKKTPAPSQPDQDLARISIPTFNTDHRKIAIHREALVNTMIPDRGSRDPATYQVVFNDSVFGIAALNDLEPETILWSNYDVLKDNPHTLSPGMELVIPPTDGIYYEWQVGDEIEAVAASFKTDPELIINWTGNNLDLVNPEIEPGSMVMIPGGEREFQQWIIPTIARGVSGVSAGVYGDGVCSGPFEGIYGTGGFVWPTIGHTLSGNDFWSGHLAIDIALTLGEPISAADSGVVVFAGWSTGGYGNVIIIDHGNGYQTLYAHLNSVNTNCGRSVLQGQTIGTGGNTGNSTGVHLHFEVRYLGGFVNPWFVLPPP